MKTTVVGNYPKIPNKPRPARLRNAINKRDRGGLTNEELEQIYDEVTVEVIQEQIEAGLDIVTDGQVHWDDDQTYIAHSIPGIEIGSLERYMDTNTYYRQPEIVGEIEWLEPLLAPAFEFARENSAKPVKAIVTGPYTLAVLSLDRQYDNREKVVQALAEALRNEVQALADAGAEHIQVNDPMLVKAGDEISFATQALTTMLDGITAETGIYTWFGSAGSILPALIDTPADVIGLDFASGPGNWDAVRTGFTKKLGFGFVDGRNTRLETPEQVADAIKRISDIIPADRLYINPSCGLEYLPRETAFDKLRNMVEGARLAEGVPA